MDLSIIITHYNTPELLTLCLDSIEKTTKDAKLHKELFVVDSDSKEETRNLLRDEYAKVKIIPFKKNLGYSKILNVGLKKARGKYILILNADIVVLEDAIEKMLRYMMKHSEVGILGPQLLDFVNNVQPSCFSFPGIGVILARRTFLGKTKWGKKRINRFFKYTQDSMDKIRRPISVDWIQGSAMMINKSALKKVGPLDERFFLYFEDIDWCRRFWQAGYKVIYSPEIKMAHYYHRSSKKLGIVLDLFFNKYARIHIVSALKYFWKYRN
jgi:GT2 family glycosyltransferase